MSGQSLKQAYDALCKRYGNSGFDMTESGFKWLPCCLQLKTPSGCEVTIRGETWDDVMAELPEAKK